MPTVRAISAVARENPGRRRARKGDGELLREEILDAAEALLVEHRTKEAVTIRAVADKVGVSAPSIYLHFADKDELFYETCRRVFEVLNLRLVEALADQEGTVVDRMLRAGHVYIAFGLEHPRQYVTLFGANSQDAIPLDQIENDPGVHAFQLLVALITAGVEAGELDRELDIQATAVAVWAAVHGTVNVLITKRGMETALNIPPDDKVIDAMLRMVVQGLRG
ncbi:MAG: TetR/AcrR family transcriptional regulator [Acidimicrobiia bacterium]